MITALRTLQPGLPLLLTRKHFAFNMAVVKKSHHYGICYHLTLGVSVCPAASAGEWSRGLVPTKIEREQISEEITVIKKNEKDMELARGWSLPMIQKIFTAYLLPVRLCACTIRHDYERYAGPAPKGT